MNNYKIPNGLIKLVIIYSLPLFLITIDRSHFNTNSKNYFGTVIGSFVAFLISKKYESFYLSKKTLLFISSLLYFVYIFIPDIYFILYGFTAYQAYNSNLLICETVKISHVIFKMEVLGLIISEVTFPLLKNLKYIFALILVVLSLIAPKPCIESDNPYECLKSQIDSASLINMEYRILVKENEHDYENKFVFPIFTDILYILTNNKLLFLFFVFFNFNLFEFIIFFISVFYTFDIFWEPFVVALKIEPNKNTTYRFLFNYIVFLMLEFINFKKF